MAQRGALPVKPSSCCRRSAVDLDDDAVDLVRQRLALALPLADELPDVFDVVHQPAIGIDLEARGVQRLQRFRMPIEIRAPVHQQEVGEEIQAALRRDVGIQLRAPCRRRHCADWQTSAAPAAPALRSCARTTRVGIMHFAAHFELRRAGRLSSAAAPESDSGTERTVRTLSVTSSPTDAIAARDAALPVRQPSIAQRHRHAVELQLADVFDVVAARSARARGAPSRAAPPRCRRCRARAWARSARTLTNPSRGLPPTRCVGESGVISSGCLGLELLQLLHQAVEFGVADLGIVEHVVAVLVMADLVAQLVDLSLHAFWPWRWASAAIIWGALEENGRPGSVRLQENSDAKAA